MKCPLGDVIFSAPQQHPPPPQHWLHKHSHSNSPQHPSSLPIDSQDAIEDHVSNDQADVDDDDDDDDFFIDIEA